MGAGKSICRSAGWVCGWLVLSAAAQGPSGQVMMGFRVPDYDRQGRLKTQLFGDQAEFLPGGDVRITRLRIEVYNGEDISMRVLSPLCLYRERTRSVESEDAVRIAREDMVVTGTGFEWNGVTERLRIHSDVRVVLMGSRERMQSGAKGEP